MASRRRIDLGAISGLLVAVGGIVGGLLLEGGRLSDITQLTGGLIVLGGTIGAVMVTTPGATLLGALRQLEMVFFPPKHSVTETIAEIIDYANRARRSGIVSLEDDLHSIPNPFFQKALSLGVDGTDLADLRRMMEIEIAVQSQKVRWEAKVFEAAGGYAPTIGIIGAVLGLIQVMKNLDDIDKVGHGIAVAFVATVYGVASANLVFLPVAARIRARADEAVRMQELILEGVCGIVQGLHPKSIERKLEAWAVHQRTSSPPGRREAVPQTRSAESRV